MRVNFWKVQRTPSEFRNSEGVLWTFQKLIRGFSQTSLSETVACYNVQSDRNVPILSPAVIEGDIA